MHIERHFAASLSHSLKNNGGDLEWEKIRFDLTMCENSSQVLSR